jgi:fumarate hydratase subunit beta
MSEHKLNTPLSDNDIKSLKAGDKVLLSGVVFTARDAAHKRLVDLINSKKPLPFDIKGQIIYYCGPTPARPGHVIGSAGPTTAGRMDGYTGPLLAAGLKATIGKGRRGKDVRDALKKHKAVYFAATGGAGALLSKHIKAAKVKAYEELGPEAIFELEVHNFPLIVANDIHGNDIFNRSR